MLPDGIDMDFLFNNQIDDVPGQDDLDIFSPKFYQLLLSQQFQEAQEQNNEQVDDQNEPEEEALDNDEAQRVIDEVKENTPVVDLEHQCKDISKLVCKFCNQGYHVKAECWALMKISRLSKNDKVFRHACRVWRSIIKCER